MASLLELLAAESLSKDYYAEDPFFTAGRGILNIQTPAPRDNTEAFLLPLLQGAVGGGLVGYGKSSAADSAFSDARSSAYIAPFIEKYTPEVIADLDAAQLSQLESNPLYKYLATEAPEGYSPKTARIDQLREMINQQTVESYLLKQQEKKAELENALFKEGKVITSEGIKTLPGFAESEAEVAGAKKKAEAEAEKSLGGSISLKDLPADVQGQLTAFRASEKNLKDIEQRFRSIDQGAISFQKDRYVSGTPAYTAEGELNILLPSIIKALGQSGNLNEQEQVRALQSSIGNKTSNPQEIADRISGIRRILGTTINSRIEGFEKGMTEGIGALRADESASEKITPPPPPMQGETREGYKARLRALK